MAKKQGSKKGLSTAEMTGIGVGITAAAAAAAGAYFLYGSKHAKQNRKMVKSWMLKAKAEALEALEKAESMTQEEYDALIDQIGAAYATVKSASKADIATFRAEMKAHWKDIAKAGKPAKKAAKKVSKKAAKKAAKKAS
jgi:hypothetical protein